MTTAAEIVKQELMDAQVLTACAPGVDMEVRSLMMMKSECLFVMAAVFGAFFIVVTVAGAAEAQMRTRKGEYYEGIQRKPYGYYWIWPPVEQREPVSSPRRGKEGARSAMPKPRMRPTQ